MPGIWGVILAAGESKRMGFPKMLLDFNGRTMLGTVIDNVKESDTGNIMVVLGGHREKLEDIVKARNVGFCVNEKFTSGMLSSVITGIENLPSDARAALIFQGDQPFINPPVINLIIKSYLATGKGIVIAVHNKRRGHPLLIDMKYRKEIAQLDPSQGLRALAMLHPDDVLEVEAGHEGILKDFDTFEEYKKETDKLR